LSQINAMSGYLRTFWVTVIETVRSGEAMKTILVPIGGSESDSVVIETALLAARSLSAHLEFLHLRIPPSEAARYTPHAEFVRGAAMSNLMDRLEAEQELRARMAALRVEEICRAQQIELHAGPAEAKGVSATWREETGNALSRLMRHARHNDLVVMSRAARPDGLPADILELLLAGCGRPLLIAPGETPPRLTGTIMVCWKETAEAARAVTAAMPLLAAATQVVIAAAGEDEESAARDAEAVARQLAWDGITARAEWTPADERGASAALLDTARRCGADMIVMGAYGHSRARELVFGGFTQTVLDGIDLPVFLLH
jgi:nucleotide-binding universal stress UspA family protein